MSVKPPPRASKPPEKRTQSGQHVAVRDYRKKLESIADGVALDAEELDRALGEYLTSVSTPPPAPDADDDEPKGPKP